MATYEFILVEQRGRVGFITLNRPDALNALNSQLISELVTAAKAFDASEDIGAIVITGNERAFAAGADIKEMADMEFADVFVHELFPGCSDLSRVRTPMIDSVAGFALGEGCALAMSCDIILAADTAKFGHPEIKLGVIPVIGGTQRLPRAIGTFKVAELVLTGRMMGADEAERAGLVSRIVPADELLDEAARVAGQIAGMSLPVGYAAKAARQAAEAAT